MFSSRIGARAKALPRTAIGRATPPRAPQPLPRFGGLLPPLPLGSNPANVDAPWELSLTPEGIYYALRYFARKFPGAPLFIVESGMPTDNGRPRADG
ncbi:hypothetical protein B7C42_05407 [Nocardia cerradoensis]|uniref:Uncharacterized protein n=1 Tax=Nocardia cerradoensis TaxID=85688 RepID=A0A231H199_9NOCA|nr:hypothetical protein B7C42_05407 [Nocardia cerradoensis]